MQIGSLQIDPLSYCPPLRLNSNPADDGGVQDFIPRIMAPATPVPAEVPTSNIENVAKKLVGKKRSLPKLPISSKISGLLHDLQKNLNPRIRESKIQAIVHSMIADEDGLSSESNAYILKRLINGVASSLGHARGNYAATLMRITSDHPKASIDELYGDVLRVYGEKGSFKDDYSRGPLEKSLGALIATSAVVRGAHDKSSHKITADTARSMLRTLRQSVTGEALKWNLTPAVMRIVPEILNNVEDISQLKKVLWRWAEERKTYHDGISIALILVMNYKLVPEESIAKLYDTLSDISKPLMAMFETGFPLNHPADGDSICPIAWELALRYCATKKGREVFGGVSAFWKVIVVPNLITKVQNLDKNLLLRSLLPIAVGLLDETETTEDVLNGSTLVKLGPAVYSSLVKRKKKMSPRESSQYKRLTTLNSVLPAELAKLCTDLKIPEKRRAHIAEMLMRWVCANCFLAPGCEKLIADIPRLLPQAMAGELVSKLLFCYLLPERSTKQGIEKSRWAYLSALIRLVSVHEKFAPLVSQTVILSSLFTQSDGSDDEEVGTTLPDKLKHGKVISLNALPGDVVKQIKRARKEAEKGEFSKKTFVSPDPALSADYAGRAFSRIIELFLKGQKSETVAGSFTAAANILSSASSESNADFLEFRNESEEFEGRRKVLTELNELETPHSGLKKCLLLIGNFLLLLSCGLDLKKELDTLAAIDKLFPLFFEAADNLKNYNNSKQRNVDDDDAPNALEQTIHLLCLMCGEDGTFASVAKTAAELVGEYADDSVTAVLFDMLDAAAKREEAEEMDDDDSEEEDGEEEDSDGEEEDVADKVTKMDGKDPGDVEGEDSDDDEDGGGSNSDDAMEVDDENDEEKGDDGADGDSSAEDEGDTDILDVDIDPDTEDPKVLAAFDNHLSNHMKLLENEKKEALQGKLRSRQKVSRMLNLISVVGNALRLRVERKQGEKGDKKTVAVFFDLILRLVEFFGGFDSHKMRVATICEKLMSRKQCFIQELSGDLGELRMEFAERLRKIVGSRKKMGRLNTVVRRLVRILVESENDEKNRKKIETYFVALEK